LRVTRAQLFRGCPSPEKVIEELVKAGSTAALSWRLSPASNFVPVWPIKKEKPQTPAPTKGQLDAIFAIVARHGVGLDIHLHEPGEMGLFNVQEICARTKALGLDGKVTISHGFCLGGITERKAAEAAETMVEAGVALVTHGAGGLTMPPIEMLLAAGVLVFAGNDDIRDTWSPYGTGDMLERAAMIGWKADFRRDDQVGVAFDLVSTAGAQALGIGDSRSSIRSISRTAKRRPTSD
jgi:cytosine/adenosine deaminase-related metal-dependent hydrolase